MLPCRQCLLSGLQGSLYALQSQKADLMAFCCCPASRSCTMPFTSPPAQKALPPAPFRMIACTSGLASQSQYSRCRVSHIASFSAFNAFGLQVRSFRDQRHPYKRHKQHFLGLSTSAKACALRGGLRKQNSQQASTQVAYRVLVLLSCLRNSIGGRGSMPVEYGDADASGRRIIISAGVKEDLRDDWILKAVLCCPNDNMKAPSVSYLGLRRLHG